MVAWRRLAELAENYIRKGSQILVEGKLRYRSYDDRDGNKRYIVEVEADMIQLLGRKQDGQGQQAASGQPMQNNSQGAILLPHSLPDPIRTTVSAKTSLPVTQQMICRFR
ncbi:MAG: single-stranded DNA-binding protein [Sphingobacterium sp.]|nr:single-stranded DNA-binding protein [Sphingobacterium sp.]